MKPFRTEDNIATIRAFIMEENMDNQKVFCLECKADLTNKKNPTRCSCGSRNFIYGSTLAYEDGVFRCSCGSTDFNWKGHVNCNPRYITSYACAKCGSAVGKETYYESPYM